MEEDSTSTTMPGMLFSDKELQLQEDLILSMSTSMNFHQSSDIDQDSFKCMQKEVKTTSCMSQFHWSIEISHCYFYDQRHKFYLFIYFSNKSINYETIFNSQMSKPVLFHSHNMVQYIISYTCILLPKPSLLLELKMSGSHNDQSQYLG